MRIRNESSVPTKDFYPIIDFITQYSKYSALATLYIADTKQSFTSGLCHKTNPELSDLNFAAPSLIELRVRSGGLYPVVNENVLGAIKVFDWEEEILLVLSHELAHLDQFYGYPVSYSNKETKEAEEAAERHAIDMLRRWSIWKDFGMV